jgi:amidophosphoribosyltransferase
MSGIVGFFCKQPALQNQLGQQLAAMLLGSHTDGADSTGMALYRPPLASDCVQLTLYHPTPYPWDALLEKLSALFGDETTLHVHANHALLVIPDNTDVVCQWLAENEPRLSVLSQGRALSILKMVETPANFVARFRLDSLQGTHGLGHVRLASESPCQFAYVQPLLSGDDYCLLHQGTVANPHHLRRRLQRQGFNLNTEQDSQIIATFLQAELAAELPLNTALANLCQLLDGFYTLVVGTLNGCSILRDPLGGKSLLIAETADWIALASQFSALSVLPNMAHAHVWEPKPGDVVELVI